MALTSSRSLGVELAGNRLMVVEVDPRTDPPGIQSAVSAETPVAGVDVTFRKLLAEHRIAPRGVHLVLSDPAASHRVLQLPPMTPGERRLFLERELGRELGGKPLLGDMVLRQVEGPPPKDEALVAAVPGEEGPRILAGLMAAGALPEVVTTAALALARAGEVLSPGSFERPTALAHWGLRGLTIVVVNEGLLKFARDIPHLTVPGFEPGEWFVTEFQRSVRQYMQTVKGGAVGTVLVGSADARFEATLGAVEGRLGLPVVNLNEALQSLLPDSADESPDLAAGMFLLPFGAGLLPVAETANLLPPAILARQRLTRLVRAAAVAGGLLVAALGYATWQASQEAATYQKAVAQATAEKQVRMAEVAEVERIKQERGKQYERIRLLRGDPLGSPPLAEVFKEISRVAPDNLHLDRLTVKRDGTGVSIRLAGKVESSDLAQAQAEFNRFYFGLQNSTFFSDVTFLPPGSARVAIQQGPSPVVEGRSAQDFQIRAEMERQRETAIGVGREINFEIDLKLRGVQVDGRAS